MSLVSYAASLPYPVLQPWQLHLFLELSWREGHEMMPREVLSFLGIRDRGFFGPRRWMGHFPAPLSPQALVRVPDVQLGATQDTNQHHVKQTQKKKHEAFGLSRRVLAE